MSSQGQPPAQDPSNSQTHPYPHLPSSSAPSTDVLPASSDPLPDLDALNTPPPDPVALAPDHPQLLLRNAGTVAAAAAAAEAAAAAASGAPTSSAAVPSAGIPSAPAAPLPAASASAFPATAAAGLGLPMAAPPSTNDYPAEASAMGTAAQQAEALEAMPNPFLEMGLPLASVPSSEAQTGDAATTQLAADLSSAPAVDQAQPPASSSGGSFDHLAAASSGIDVGSGSVDLAAAISSSADGGAAPPPPPPPTDSFDAVAALSDLNVQLSAGEWPANAASATGEAATSIPDPVPAAPAAAADGAQRQPPTRGETTATGLASDAASGPTGTQSADADGLQPVGVTSASDGAAGGITATTADTRSIGDPSPAPPAPRDGDAGVGISKGGATAAEIAERAAVEAREAREADEARQREEMERMEREAEEREARMREEQRRRQEKEQEEELRRREAAAKAAEEERRRIREQAEEKERRRRELEREAAAEARRKKEEEEETQRKRREEEEEEEEEKERQKKRREEEEEEEKERQRKEKEGREREEVEKRRKQEEEEKEAARVEREAEERKERDETSRRHVEEKTRRTEQAGVQGKPSASQELSEERQPPREGPRGAEDRGERGAASQPTHGEERSREPDGADASRSPIADTDASTATRRVIDDERAGRDGGTSDPVPAQARNKAEADADAELRPTSAPRGASATPGLRATTPTPAGTGASEGERKRKRSEDEARAEPANAGADADVAAVGAAASHEDDPGRKRTRVQREGGGEDARRARSPSQARGSLPTRRDVDAMDRVRDGPSPGHAAAEPAEVARVATEDVEKGAARGGSAEEGAPQAAQDASRTASAPMVGASDDTAGAKHADVVAKATASGANLETPQGSSAPAGDSPQPPRIKQEPPSDVPASVGVMPPSRGGQMGDEVAIAEAPTTEADGNARSSSVSRSTREEAVARPPAEKPRTNTERGRPKGGAEQRLERERDNERQRATSAAAAAAAAAAAEQERWELEQAREREYLRAREREEQMLHAARLAEEERERAMIRENEETRLTWLSLPANDHPSYYSDTEDSSASSLSDLDDQPRPLAAKGLQKFLPGPRPMRFGPPPRKAHVGAGPRVMISVMDVDAPLSSERTREEDLTPPPPALVAPARRHQARGVHAANGHASEGLEQEEEDFSDDSDEAREQVRLERVHAKQHRTGNRGNKLKRKRGSRWVRRGKLGGFTEARSEKEIHDRMRTRIAALQRAGMQALLNVAQEPKLTVPSLARGWPSSGDAEDDAPELTSTSLAPSLLRPIVSARQLLESQTLKHTFRNPHVAALSRTALDLRESEGLLSRGLGRCFAALERIDMDVLARWPPAAKGARADDAPRDRNGARPPDRADAADRDETRQEDKRHETEAEDERKRTRRLREARRDERRRAELVQETLRNLNRSRAVDREAVGAEGTRGHSDELNPAFARLDELFVTPGGLPIPLGSEAPREREMAAVGEGEEGAGSGAVVDGVGGEGGSAAGQAAQAVLSVAQQRDVVRAALDCLQELASDSREYVERLDEVRSAFAAVKRRRAQVWEAVRLWALTRLDADEEAGLARGGRGGVAGQGVGATLFGQRGGSVSDDGELPLAATAPVVATNQSGAGGGGGGGSSTTATGAATTNKRSSAKGKKSRRD